MQIWDHDVGKANNLTNHDEITHYLIKIGSTAESVDFWEIVNFHELIIICIITFLRVKMGSYQRNNELHKRIDPFVNFVKQFKYEPIVI